MTQSVMLAKKMKHRYTNNHYTITWIISHESVLTKRMTQVYIQYTWAISLLTGRVTDYLPFTWVISLFTRRVTEYHPFTWVISLLIRRVTDYHPIYLGYLSEGHESIDDPEGDVREEDEAQVHR